MGLHYYSIETLPSQLDVVWCYYPIEEVPRAPSEVPHPCLVRALQLSDDHRTAWVGVCFGTSKNIMDDPLDLVISNMSEMNTAGLYYATRFKLGKFRKLPWASEFFAHPSGKGSPIIGKLGQ